MMIGTAILPLAAFFLTPAHAFAPTSLSKRPAAAQPCFVRPLVVLQMSDDFGSLMPAKPEMTRKEKLEESSDQFIYNFQISLGEGVEEPPELETLRVARAKGADSPELTIRIYELMIEQGMRYDKDEAGILTPTDFDIKNNLDVSEVQAEFAYLYKYGIGLIKRGLMAESDVKKIVVERLIERTGLTPEEFDKWLGY